MKINLMVVGALSENCYILQSDKKNAMIIDAGDNAEEILNFCKKNSLIIKSLVFTHGHFDHLGAMTKILEKTDAKTYIHTLDEELMRFPERAQSSFFYTFEGYEGKNADVCFEDNDEITLDDISLKVMHTSGHTKGSCVFICNDVIFTGDTLFAGSAGRTDLYGGNEKELLKSLLKIAKLAGDYTILPGHGQSSKLSYERATNPYMGNMFEL